MKIALLNHAEQLDDEDLVSMAEALELQANEHFVPAWGLRKVSVSVYEDPHDIPHNANRIVFFDDADGADALGYHTETPQGKPYAKVFVAPILDADGEVLFSEDGDSVSATASHELLEMMADPDCEHWVEGPELDEGWQYAREVCDPVEAHSYSITLSDGETEVSVSNFVLPAWFEEEPDDDSAFDYMEVLEEPFTLAPGGYMQVRGEPGSEQDIFAEEESMPSWKRHGKRHHAARAQRRKRRQR